MTGHGVSARDVKRFLEQRRAPLFDRARTAGQPDASAPLSAIGRELGREHAAILDELLSRSFANVAAAAAPGSSPEGSSRAGNETSLALAGVGSHGRGAVALGADLDVRFLGRKMEPTAKVAEALLYPLWDAGLAVGHQVVTMDDLLAEAKGDLPSATSLLDWRFVAGDRELSDELTTRAAEGIFAPSELEAFFGRLEREIEGRHARFGGSVYMLEPDVKNGRGGLRDLDSAWWTVRARWRVTDFSELVRIGVLLPRQLGAVEKARELMWRIRNLLHAKAGRRSDRLGFDEQEAIAMRLGYASELAASGDAHAAVGVAVEGMMSDYYRAARTVTRFRELVAAKATPMLRRRRRPVQDLGQGVQLFDGEVTFARHELIDEEPSAALLVVSAAVAHEAPLRAAARSRVVDACGDEDWCARLRADPRAARLFVDLVTSSTETKLRRGSVMRELHDLGLLLAMVPEFAPVVGRVHHDTYHVYTVDAHSVAAVDRLGEIVRGDIVQGDGEDRWAGALACRLAAEVVRPRVLFFATLLHDVGKAIGRRDHSERGAELARVILTRLRFEPREIDDVCRHIVHHLTMYLTATRRDVDDPATIEELGRVVRDLEGLRELYLLTVADLSTTSPTSMTSWKARMLDELFVATEAYLRGHAPDADSLDKRLDDILAHIESTIEESPSAARDLETRRAFAERFVRSMPERYIVANPAEAVVAHAEVVRRYMREEGTHALAPVPGGRGGAAELCIVTADRPGRLADIAAALTASKLAVDAAQIYSCRLDVVKLAVDFFWVHHPGGEAGLERALSLLDKTLKSVLSGQLGAEALVLRRGTRASLRSGPRVVDRIIIDQNASPEHTVVEVITRDRPGLLFELSNTIHRQGLSIALAKIATEGRRVADVFYVSEPDGKKVTIPERLDALEKALEQCIQNLDQGE